MLLHYIRSKGDKLFENVFIDAKQVKLKACT